MGSMVYTDYIHQYLWACVNQIIVLKLVVKISAKVYAKYFCKSIPALQHCQNLNI